MNHIHYTKRRLTLTFFGAILSIILFLGGSFFTFRFLESIHKDTQEKEILFSNQVIPPIFEDSFEKIDFKKGEKGKNDRRMRGPFMVRFDSEGNIIHKDFSAQNEREEFLQKLYQFKDSDTFRLEMGNGKFIHHPDGSETLLFSPARYPIHEYITDILIFCIFTLLFAFPLYYIVRLFVDKTLKPVEENLKDMEDFVHNAGHELKTPISVIHSDLQMLKTKKVYDEDFIDEMLGEVDRLDVLMEGLVDMADIHSNREQQTVNIFHEIKSILKTYENQIRQKDISVEIQKLSDISVESNLAYFQIFLGNFVSNAIKYNKQGGKIYITVDKHKLVIEDTGLGIDDIHHSKIWQRFYKVNGVKNTGSGIGLSLVKKIADMYRWKLRVESKNGQFTRFTVSFK